MFCYQCEQTAKGEGCTVMGVCGKSHEIASLQDLLVEALKGLALFAVEGRKVGVVDNDVNIFTFNALFFDAYQRQLRRGQVRRLRARGRPSEGQAQGEGRNGGRKDGFLRKLRNPETRIDRKRDGEAGRGPCG